LEKEKQYIPPELLIPIRDPEKTTTPEEIELMMQEELISTQIQAPDQDQASGSSSGDIDPNLDPDLDLDLDADYIPFMLANNNGSRINWEYTQFDADDMVDTGLF
jgi:hypothetical protein